MKALTLTQPWATLVAIGAKRIETRSFQRSYRGPLAIHAAKTFPWDAQTFANENRQCNSALKAGLLRYPGQMRAGRHPLASRDVCASDLPTGAIIAVCNLVGCEENDPDCWPGPGQYIYGNRNNPDFRFILDWPVPEPERLFGDYSPGRFMWLLANIRALPEPIPAKGALGIWNYDGELPL